MHKDEVMSPKSKSSNKTIKLADLRVDTGPFVIFAIEAPLLKPHQIANTLNTQLSWDLRRQADLEIFNEQDGNEPHLFYLYSTDAFQILLIDHKRPQAILPKYQSYHYLLLLRLNFESDDPYRESGAQEFLDLIQEHPDIFAVDIVHGMRSSHLEDLIIDIETHFSILLQAVREENPVPKLHRHHRP